MLMCADTVSVLGPNAMLCENRSLLWERLFNPLANASAQRSAMEKAIGQPIIAKKLKAWQDLIVFQLSLRDGIILFGKLHGRLLINLSSGLGVGITLDRLSGIPTIPGSSVKGCARRYAILELSEAADDDSRASICRDIALVFGCCKHDWITRRAFPSSPAGEKSWKKHRSDLAWACGASWDIVAEKAQAQLAGAVRIDDRTAPGAHQAVSNGFGGLAHFLPAVLWDMAAKDLELEAWSNHHPQYANEPVEPDRGRFPAEWNEWKRRWEEWHRNYGGAPDNEDPQVTYAPAVAGGQVFAFVIQGEPRMAARGKGWLQQGLALLGIGSRTQSGYGIFDIGDAVQQLYGSKIEQLHESEARLRVKEREQQNQQEQDEIRRREAEQEQQALSQMSDEEKLEYQLAQLNPEQFWGKVQRFRDMDKHEQKRMIRVLQTRKADIWTELKVRARRGGQWAQVEQAIREIAKIRKLGKMP